MGFMDKIKTAAADVTAEAKKATAGTQGKVEETKLRRRLDDAAKQLGYLVYRERSQGTPAGSEADGLVAEMTALEGQIAETAASVQAKQQEAEAERAAARAQAASAPGPQAPGESAQPPPPQAPPEPPAGDPRL